MNVYENRLGLVYVYSRYHNILIKIIFGSLLKVFRYTTVSSYAVHNHIFEGLYSIYKKTNI